MTSPQVTGFAELTILTLRSNGASDAEILHYTQPDPESDLLMEERQLQATGSIYAPAADVKKAMRELLAISPTQIH